MKEAIPLSCPEVIAEDRERVLEVLSGRALSLGPRLPQFEQAVARAAGTRFAVAVNSGTSALHLCVKAAGLEPGDEAITTPFSFVASANCLLYERAVPRFVDIDPHTYNIDVSKIQERITERTRAILPVHVFGRPCEMDRIGDIARQYGLAVIEDSCEAIGAEYRGRPAGSLGDSASFAFYPNKQITTGEGGAIATDDEETARLCRSWRNQGRGEDGAWLQHERLGYNYRLSDLNCALGIGQLSRLAQTLALRTAAAGMYAELLAEIPEVIAPLAASPECATSWFVYVIRLQSRYSRADRDEILRLLQHQGIGCGNYFTPIHLQPFYRERFGYRPGDFPVTEHVAARTIALPFFNRLSAAQAEAVVRALAGAIATLSRRSRAFAAAAG